jgi:hypothetical protein
MPILFDLEPLTESQTDAALEFIFKAIGSGEDDPSIWEPHDNPLIARLVELFTERGLTQIAGVRTQLEAWLAGRNHRAQGMGVAIRRPDGLMIRWDKNEMQLVDLYLSNLPPAEFTLEDHMLLIDYLFQKYLPADELRTEASWLATRSTLMGRVQANMEQTSAAQADTIISALPLTAADAVAMFAMSGAQKSILEYASAHAGENVQKWSDDARHRLRKTVIAYAEQRSTTGTAGPSLETQLFDNFGEMNRDWRRIAVTESTECQNQGYIASLPAGTKVKRIEQYQSACKFCRRIDGKIMEVVGADAPNKDGAKQIWAGKTNINRSSSPRRRVGSDLIERKPAERWWCAAGAQHPWCRGRWSHVAEHKVGDDPEFSHWLQRTLNGD